MLRIGLGTIISGLGFCHTFVGPRAGVIYVIGTSTCKAKTVRVTGALRSRRISCLTITMTSRKISLQGTKVATGVVIVGPRVDDFGALFRCSLRPRICDFHLLSTLIHRTRGRNIAGFPVRVGLSAKVRHLNFRPAGSVTILMRHLGRRSTIVPHSIFSRFMNDSGSSFSSFSLGRCRRFLGKNARLRSTFHRGVLHRVYGDTNVRRFPRQRLRVIHLKLKLCNIGPHGGTMLRAMKALEAAVLRVRRIPTRRAIKCDHGKLLTESDHVTTLPVKCTSKLSHGLNYKHKCYLIGKVGTPCINGVYVSIYVVSIASVSYGRNSATVVFNRRLPMAMLDSIIKAVPCRVLAKMDAQIGHICCGS